jgi:glutaconyl-CoA/methylmalonyl-CoA decarboxylase subunit gamma
MNDFLVSVNDKKLKVGFDKYGKLKINDSEHEYSLSHLNSNSYLLKIENESYLISLKLGENSKYLVTLKGQVFETLVRTVLEDKASTLINAKAAQHSEVTVKAPMPGMIIKIKKKAGEKVNSGESVLILEAMKMENDIRSPVSGIIENIKISEGKTIEKGGELFTIR